MNKHICFLLLSLGLGSGQVMAQHCPDKSISTNPDSPVSETGSIAQPNPFDWREEEFDIYSQYQANSVIESPFFHANNLDLDHLTESLDMQPEDGWELLAYKTGKNPDGTNMSTQADFVYVVLYNKYKGIMRVMVAGDPSGNHNGAQLLLEFGSSEYYPSVYSHISDIHEVADFTTADDTAFAVMRYKEGSSKWFYSDFPIAYDPCTCMYESKMSIGISLVDKATISITGNIIGTLSNIVNQTSGIVSENGYAFKDVKGAATKAQKTYTSINKFVEKQEQALKIEGITADSLKILGKIKDATKKGELNAFQEALKSPDFLIDGLKLAPYIGGALELLDFFISGGKKSPGPPGPQEVKLTPTAINANIKLQGDLEAPYYYDDIIFYTPGSKNANNGSIPEQYPYYNEIMGTVNLMQKPEVFFGGLSEIIYTEITTLDQGPVSIPFRFISFQLNSESVELILNPSADVDISEVYGQIVMEIPSLGVPIYQPQFTLPNQSLISANVGSSIGLDVEDTIFYSQMMPLGCMGDLTMGIALFGPNQLSNAKVYLKIFANLNREDSDENTQNVLFVGKYPAILTDKIVDTSFDWSTPYNFPGKASLNSIITSDVSAWDTIVIESGTTFQPGTNGITIIAGEEIIVEPGVEIPTGVELIIGDPTQCNQTITLQNSTQIQTFCNSSTYKSPLRNARMQPQIPLINAPVPLTLFPNPTAGTATLRYELPEKAAVSIAVRDLMGRLVMSVTQSETKAAGQHEQLLDVQHLAAGVYLVVFQTGKQQQTVRLVKE